MAILNLYTSSSSQTKSRITFPGKRFKTIDQREEIRRCVFTVPVATDEMPDENVISFVNAISRVLCWSVSFYPQPILNWRRKSTIGLTLEYPTLNVLGFLYYTISTATFLYSPLIRSQYAYRNPISPEPTVRFNDLAFGLHAVVLCILVFSQFWCWGYRRERGLRISRPVGGIFMGCLMSTVVVSLIVAVRGIDGGRDASGWAWIDVVYAFGYVKLLITFVKYIPQVWANYKRKSTTGWSIEQVLLDFVGGILSILQLILDSSLQNDWSGITGNPVKLGLGNISCFFDIMFIVQHYWLYRDSEKGYIDDDIDRRIHEDYGTVD
ncbi:MAG: hypothetical protein M4579_005517 [Chaenotheca gracillima]|nr:MAG: hypothetical protein M4579_005517 [Chaenotheca gracillima]